MVHSALKEAAGVIGEAEDLALACHVGPDGDALGSMFALAIAARDAGKEVVTSFGSPLQCSREPVTPFQRHPGCTKRLSQGAKRDGGP